MSDQFETARQLADDLRRWTERMNEGLAAAEREMAAKGIPPCSTVVMTHVGSLARKAPAEHERANVLG